MLTSKKLFLLIGILLATVLVYQNCSQNVRFADLPSEIVMPVCRDVKAEEVSPKLLWDWQAAIELSENFEYSTFLQVMASPMVADLNGDKIPEVVFVNFSINGSDWFEDSNLGNSSRSSYLRNGVLRIVDGRNGKTIKSIGHSELAPHASQSPLLIDIDRDGFVEIIYLHYHMDKLVALNHDGSERWVFRLPTRLTFANTGFHASDTNQDGIAEIHVGQLLITENQSREPYSLFSFENHPVVHLSTIWAPLDPEKQNEISFISSHGVYDINGKLKFPLSPAWGYLAVADIYPEHNGMEIIKISNHSSRLQIFNGLTGALIVDNNLMPYNDLKCSNGTIGGGPPTVGNFDDSTNELEIAVATGRHLTIFDRTGEPKYKTVTQDCSSQVTGLTSYDLNGDGKPEILYADEEYFRIFEINNNELEVIYKIPNPSGTLYEYPLVVDVNGDRSAEIVVSANNYAASGFYKDPDERADWAEAQNITGVRAFTSQTDDSWMPTRPIWNQYNFHPDYVNDRAQVRLPANIDTSFFRRNNQGINFTGKCTQ